MKKPVLALILFCLMAASPLFGQVTDKDCPNCPPKGSSLDPNWREINAPPLVPGERPDCHRVQFGKQNCMDCHAKETPASYNQWLASRHGINNVKCGICHGDVANYRARPDKVVCMGCHSQQVKNMPPQALVTNCSYCHKGHWFTAHKIPLYEKFMPGRTGRFNVPGF